MNLVKRVYSKIINSLSRVAKTKYNASPFFTKDIFSDKKFNIGEFTYGNPQILFENDNSNLIIGKFCSIAENVTIFLGGNHRTDWISTYPFNALPKHFPEAKHIKGHPTTKGDVIIGNDVWIGRNVTIMSGVTIEDGAVIGACSVVTKDIGPYEIWAGNPAKFIKKRFDNEKISSLQKIKWWDWDEKHILDNISQLQSDNFKKFKDVTY